MKRIFVTGGHFAPAIAVIKKLQKKADWQIYYLGRKQAMEDDAALALEYQEIRQLPGVNYLILNTGRLQPQFFINLGQSIRAFLKIFIGLGQSLLWIIKYQPDVILSFGGYVAVPIVFWGWLLGVPIATHEQTLVSGKANRLISLFADKILVSWPDSLVHFPKDKSVLTGNPLRDDIQILAGKHVPQNDPPLIFITGGNQGSHAINLAVEANLLTLLKKYQIIHQTGDASFGDFTRLQKFTGKNYHPAKFFSSQEMAQNLFRADLVISRAGANVTTEIMALGKPALIIPLPWSSQDEQRKNAQLVKTAGLGEILEQNDQTDKLFVGKIDSIIKNRRKYSNHKAETQARVVFDAADRVVDQVVKLADK